MRKMRTCNKIAQDFEAILDMPIEKVIIEQEEEEDGEV